MSTTNHEATHYGNFSSHQLIPIPLNSLASNTLVYILHCMWPCIVLNFL
jgi:hypothetical protein